MVKEMIEISLFYDFEDLVEIDGVYVYSVDKILFISRSVEDFVDCFLVVFKKVDGNWVCMCFEFVFDIDFEVVDLIGLVFDVSVFSLWNVVFATYRKVWDN